MSENKIHLNQPLKGLNKDLNKYSQEDKSSYSFALNANQESEDGDFLAITNEQSNQLQVDFSDLHIIGRKFIPELNKTIFFSLNSKTNVSEIGEVEYLNKCNFPVNNVKVETCENGCGQKEVKEKDLNEDYIYSTEACNKYKTIVSSECLNFNINFPIHEIEYSLNLKEFQLFWTDSNNEMRTIDLYNIPYKNNSKILDCDKIKIFPDFKVPCISVDSINNDGSLYSGVYQFLIAYSNTKGEEISQYYSPTNPVPIWDDNITNLLSFPTNKAINLTISNLDTTYKFVNIAVIKTNNYTQSYELVGTFDIVSENIYVSYTGNNKQPKLLSENDLFYRRPYYTKAESLTSQNNILMWGNLESSDTINYQKIANQIELKWIATAIPYNDDEKPFSKPEIANKYRGYLRDEVYSFYIAFLKKNGEYTHRFHIPGPSPSSQDRVLLANNDIEAFTNNDKCSSLSRVEAYQVYNNAKQESFNNKFIDDNCTIQTSSTGKFGSYLSDLRYPNNRDVWGNLAGLNIRHHKFPNTNVVPLFFQNVLSGNFYILSLGIKIDEAQIRKIIEDSDLSQEEKDEIIGFNILRDSRANNESIVAKGLLYNIGQYQKNGETILFPNYPYNDLNKDPFLSSVQPEHHSGNNDGTRNLIISEKKVYISNPEVYHVTLNRQPNLVTNDEPGDYDDDDIYKVCMKYRVDGQYRDFNFEFVCYKEKIDGDNTYDFKFLAADEMVEVTAANRYKEFDIGDIAINKKYLEIYLPIGFIKPNRDIGTVLAFIFEVDHTPGQHELLFNKSLNLDEGKYTEIISAGAVTPYTGWGNPMTIQFYKLPNFKYSNGNQVKLTNKALNKIIILEDLIEYGPLLQDIRLNGFTDKTRYTFHGPNTHFSKPALGNILYLENLAIGSSKGIFTKVLDEPKYSLPTKFIVNIASSIALSTIIRTNIGAGTFGWPTMSISMDSFAPTFLQVLDMMEKLIPLKEYGIQYLSVGNYTHYENIYNNVGNLVRAIDLAKYLGSSLHSVGDTYNINNHQRETSVYLKVKKELKFPHEISNNSNARDNSKITLSSFFKEKGRILNLDEVVKRNISSYYASIRRIVNDQYGELYSNRVVSLGDCNRFTENGNSSYEIYGGDTFVNKFALKRKLPFFIDNRVGYPDKSDVSYDLLGNVAYPTYWISTFPLEVKLSVSTLSRAEAVVREMQNFQKAGNMIKNFVTGGAAGMVRFLNFGLALAKDIISTLGIKNTNLDLASNIDRNINEEGYFYLFNYGIPYFFVESDINVDLRQAENSLEKNFFPNISKDIPTWWLQEKNVSIAHDNYYFYNRDFSKQNIENFISHLPKDFDPIKDKKNIYPTRVIYSQIKNLEEKQDNWSVYKANNYYDFSFTDGKLVSLSSLEQGKVLVRFENNFYVYNAFIQLETDNKTAIVGTGNMFTTPPQQYSSADVGYAGSQHKVIQKTKFGYFWIDAKRGNVLKLNIGQGLEELSRKGMKNWFRENLPFNIIKDFPDFNIDNSFNKVGLTTTFDNKYDRYIITKLDYKLKQEFKNKVSYDKNNFKFYLTDNDVKTEIELGDSTYFLNKCFTIGYSLQTESWISFYSYKPNYYIEKIETFESGINSSNEHSKDDKNTLWIHDTSNLNYQTFYNTLYPFKLETFQNEISEENLKSIQVDLSVKRYTGEYD